MQEIIERIVDQNKEVFGTNYKIEKSKVGFTNDIFIVNDKYIVKICTDPNNEKSFLKEINFYNSNKGNDLIPKLYYSNTEKNDIPYYYEIIEKVEGVSLYNVWHLLNEAQREDIIRKICDAMKQFHSNIGESYDWNKKTSDLFILLYEYCNSVLLASLFEDIYSF